MQWLSIHPKFLKNRLFIAGDSYGGKLVAMVALEIAIGISQLIFLYEPNSIHRLFLSLKMSVEPPAGNEAGLEPHMSLKVNVHFSIS